MEHRIVVLGAGYTGAHTAGRLARRLHAADTSITLVDDRPTFTERVRMHQLAAGQDVRERPLRDVFAGTHVALRQARVTAVDPSRRVVHLSDGDLAYDSLVYALGSTAGGPGLPGVAEHAHHVTGRDGALRLRDRLATLAAGDTVLIVGGGLTAIEAATELAEAHPRLRVAIAARDGVGTSLNARARRHLDRALARLGVTVHTGVEVTAVAPGVATTATGHLPAAVVVWAAGFATHPIAAASGLEVAPDGRIVVDGTMRSVSHPEVYAVGDAGFARGATGAPLRMSCASGIPMAWQAADALAARLTGRPVPESPIRYYAQCISLGRRDGIIQFVDAGDRPGPAALLGRPAARVKELVAAGAAWSIGHPTLGQPTRAHPITTTGTLTSH